MSSLTASGRYVETLVDAGRCLFTIPFRVVPNAAPRRVIGEVKSRSGDYDNQWNLLITHPDTKRPEWVKAWADEMEPVGQPK
ncbi:hypothetical protein [Amycolatopsis sp. DSM 110486]|uniref:hypothetical protein n=1 Tax=Amycolatopsis sp. DSM 110486 TaxID=2865832 RepID=UPI001C6965E8|nr:hypothetical protein [Amycolatopsis sp. DSM 110486]QYN17555.1 hypothetical protein K1T34_32740 [Amycolatopsis sp. DSM 110486]